MVGIGLATGVDQSWYCPVQPAGPAGLSWDELTPLVEFLATSAVGKSSYKLKEALLALRGAGADLDGASFDCVLAAYLADSRSRTPTLGALSREWGGPPAPDPELYLGKGVAVRQPSTLTMEDAAQLFGGEAALSLIHI